MNTAADHLSNRSQNGDNDESGIKPGRSSLGVSNHLSEDLLFPDRKSEIALAPPGGSLLFRLPGALSNTELPQVKKEDLVSDDNGTLLSSTRQEPATGSNKRVTPYRSQRRNSTHVAQWVLTQPRSVFRLIDKNNDGFINAPDLLFFLRKASTAWRSSGNLHKELSVFQSLDLAGNGIVSEDQFCARIGFVHDGFLDVLGKLAVEHVLLPAVKSKANTVGGDNNDDEDNRMSPYSSFPEEEEEEGHFSSTSLLVSNRDEGTDSGGVAHLPFIGEEVKEKIFTEFGHLLSRASNGSIAFDDDCDSEESEVKEEGGLEEDMDGAVEVLNAVEASLSSSIGNGTEKGTCIGGGGGDGGGGGGDGSCDRAQKDGGVEVSGDSEFSFLLGLAWTREEVTSKIASLEVFDFPSNSSSVGVSGAHGGGDDDDDDDDRKSVPSLTQSAAATLSANAGAAHSNDHDSQVNGGWGCRLCSYTNNSDVDSCNLCASYAWQGGSSILAPLRQHGRDGDDGTEDMKEAITAADSPSPLVHLGRRLSRIEAGEMIEELRPKETRRRRVGGGYANEVLDPKTNRWMTADRYFKRHPLLYQVTARIQQQKQGARGGSDRNQTSNGSNDGTKWSRHQSKVTSARDLFSPARNLSPERSRWAQDPLPPPPPPTTTTKMTAGPAEAAAESSTMTRKAKKNNHLGKAEVINIDGGGGGGSSSSSRVGRNRTPMRSRSPVQSKAGETGKQAQARTRQVKALELESKMAAREKEDLSKARQNRREAAISRMENRKTSNSPVHPHPQRRASGD